MMSDFWVGRYSRVPNKQTGRLLENEKKSHLYTLIQTYTFINFQQRVPPIHLFPLTLLLILVLSMAHFDLRRPQKPLWGHNQKLINYKRIFYWNTKQPQLNASKNPTYTFINFQQKVPPTLLLIFKEISHLHFYSDLHFYLFSRTFPIYTIIWAYSCIQH